MAIPQGMITTYPKDLTNAAWQKKKSLLDTVKKGRKTGLGEALQKAEEAWNLVEWEWLDSATAGPPPVHKWRSPEQILGDEGKRRAEKELATKGAVLEKALLDVGRKARDVIADEGMSKSTRTAATAISKKALAYAAKIKGIQFGDFDKEAERLVKKLELVMKTFGEKVLELERKIGEWEQTPTANAWRTRPIDLNNAFRSLGNVLGNDPQYADLWRVWEKWDGQQVTKICKSEDDQPSPELLHHIQKEVRPALVILKRRFNL